MNGTGRQRADCAHSGQLWLKVARRAWVWAGNSFLRKCDWDAPGTWVGGVSFACCTCKTVAIVLCSASQDGYDTVYTNSFIITSFRLILSISFPHFYVIFLISVLKNH